MNGIVTLTTDHYLVRPLTRADISDDWRDLLKDPEIARRLNTKPRRLKKRDLTTYLDGFDNKDRILLGIFHKQSKAHMGLFTLYASANRKNALVNLLIAHDSVSSFGGMVGLRKLLRLLWGFAFFEHGFEGLVASVVGTNTRVVHFLQRSGWQEIKRSEKASADGSGIVELIQFQLTRTRYIVLNPGHD